MKNVMVNIITNTTLRVDTFNCTAGIMQQALGQNTNAPFGLFFLPGFPTNALFVRAMFGFARSIGFVAPC